MARTSLSNARTVDVRKVGSTTLVVGVLALALLVATPTPVDAVLVQAPGVEVLDLDTGIADTLATRLTFSVVIPAGERIPLGSGEIRYSTGTPAFDAQGRMTGATSCVATILSITGQTPNFGSMTGYGYQIIPAASGYGYTFTNRFGPVSFAGYNVGYGPGIGYGYGGSATATVVIAVTLQASSCPNVAAFGGNEFATFNFQALVGASGVTFASLPTTLRARNPEVAFAAATGGNTATAAGSSIQQTVADGFTTSFGFTFVAGALGSDGLTYVPTGATFPLTLPDETFASSLQIVTNQAIPEGAVLNVRFQDQQTTGSTFTGTSGGFSIDGPTLSGLTGGVPPAGFIQVTMSNVPPGTTPGQFIDLVLSLDVPQTYFAGPPVLNPGTFRLIRFSDAGVRSTTDPSCTFVGAANANTDYRYSCTLTDFSAFALVAFPLGGGGGGGGTVVTTPAPTPPATTPPATTPPSGGDGDGSGAGDGADDGEGDDTPSKKKKDGIPGFELVAFLAALGVALAVVVRRRSK